MFQVRPESFGGVPDGVSDSSAAFAAAIEALSDRGGGILCLDGGVYGVSRTLDLPCTVSLELGGGTLRALPGFEGGAVVTKGMPTESREHASYGHISGGTIDGGGQQVIGIQTGSAPRLRVNGVETRNCLRKGIHIGAGEDAWGYEVMLSQVRCYHDAGVHNVEGGIGLHIDKATDCMVSQFVSIGYHTGVRSDSGSNDFMQAHVWSVASFGPMKYGFYLKSCGDSLCQCYGDGPSDGGKPAYAFYDAGWQNRISDSRVLSNQSNDGAPVAGIHVTEPDSGGTYYSIKMCGSAKQPLTHAFGGCLDSSTIFAISYVDGVEGGRAASQWK